VLTQTIIGSSTSHKSTFPVRGRGRLFSFRAAGSSHMSHSAKREPPTNDRFAPVEGVILLQMLLPILWCHMIFVDQLWEQQCHLMVILLAAKQIVKMDEMRRLIESLTLEQRKEWSYNEKWSTAMANNLLLEKKILTLDELQSAHWGEEQEEVKTR
jgi:ABC-type histidine transport system ATPase subunit